MSAGRAEFFVTIAVVAEVMALGGPFVETKVWNYLWNLDPKELVEINGEAAVVRRLEAAEEQQ